MKVSKALVSAAVGGLLLSAGAWADTPATLEGPHGHGVNVSGKITLFRAQEQGLEIGSDKDKLDAEILVKLDSEPDKVFGISLHDQNAAAREMVETLRQAYLSDKPITIQHRRDEGKKNLKIIWVEYSKK